MAKRVPNWKKKADDMHKANRGGYATLAGFAGAILGGLPAILVWSDTKSVFKTVLCVAIPVLVLASWGYFSPKTLGALVLGIINHKAERHGRRVIEPDD